MTSYHDTHERFGKGALLVFLFLLLFAFGKGSHLLYGGTSFLLLAAYHFIVDRRFPGEKLAASGLMNAHIAVSLLLCTLVIWATTDDEESPYWIIYFLPIAVASFNLNFRRTLVTCAAAALLFLSQVPPKMYLDPLERREEGPELLIFCVMYFIVGLIIQTFSERGRQQLRTQQRLNDRLLENQKTLTESLAKLETAEELLRRKERLAALGEMAAGIAHEIRNPLGIVSSSAQLLKNRLPELGEKESQLFDIVQEETTRLNNLITDFLAFSRPRPVNRQEIDLGALLRRSMEHIQPLAAPKKVLLQTTLPDTPFPVHADPEMLEQVVLNLLLNALEAVSEEGGIEVRLRMEEERAVVEVQDDGVGISEENLSRIFNPFFTTREKGTGLGLANAHRIIEEHGGEITAASEPGRGATFTVKLPAGEV